METKLNHKVTDAEILRFMASCEETESNTQVKLNAIAAKLERLETVNAELLAACETAYECLCAIPTVSVEVAAGLSLESAIHKATKGG